MTFKKSLLALAISGFCFSIFAQDIQLPKPEIKGGMPLMEAISARKSSREFDNSRNLSSQQLSDMLWCAWGFNRPGKRTVPTAMNLQEASIYVITPEAAYKYDPEENKLIFINKGDFRKQASKQDFAENANLNIVMVSDTGKQTKPVYGGVTLGAVTQNIYLWCASQGVGTVVRGGFDGDALAEILKLNSNEKVYLVQTVGY